MIWLAELLEMGSDDLFHREEAPATAKGTVASYCLPATPLPPIYDLLYMKNVMKWSGISALILGKKYTFWALKKIDLTLFSSLVSGYVGLIYREALGTVAKGQEHKSLSLHMHKQKSHR